MPLQLWWCCSSYTLTCQAYLHVTFSAKYEVSILHGDVPFIIHFVCKWCIIYFVAMRLWRPPFWWADLGARTCPVELRRCTQMSVPLSAHSVCQTSHQHTHTGRRWLLDDRWHCSGKESWHRGQSPPHSGSLKHLPHHKLLPIRYLLLLWRYLGMCLHLETWDNQGPAQAFPFIIVQI